MTSQGGPGSSPQPIDPADLLAHATAKWRTFPSTAHPRPLVLTSHPTGWGTFVTDDARIAVDEGLLSVESSVPMAAVEALAKAGLLRGNRPESLIRVMSALPSSMGFGTDRGGKQLPAWLLSISGIDGTCYVMDVESQALAYPSTASVTSVHPVGGYAKLLGDGLTVRVDFDPPWLTRNAGAASTAVDVLESQTSVVFAPSLDADADADADADRDGADTAGPDGDGSENALTFRLLEPLGTRVLCDAEGSPVIVARRKRNSR